MQRLAPIALVSSRQPPHLLLALAIVVVTVTGIPREQKKPAKVAVLALTAACSCLLCVQNRDAGLLFELTVVTMVTRTEENNERRDA